jgi:hypothetical protein
MLRPDFTLKKVFKPNSFKFFQILSKSFKILSNSFKIFQNPSKHKAGANGEMGTGPHQVLADLHQKFPRG